MSSTLIVWPHQLFDQHPGLNAEIDSIVLFEDPLFFGDSQYPARMHKQKLWLHRASMTRYKALLEQRGFSVSLERHSDQADTIHSLLRNLRSAGCTSVVVAELVDFSAEARLRTATDSLGLELTLLDSPGWLNTKGDNQDWSDGRKRWFMAEFYKSQRRRLKVLMEENEPVGGKWSFDEDNRKKVPKKLYPTIPTLEYAPVDHISESARQSVLKDFPDAPGSLERLFYPSSHAEADRWLQSFLEQRFECFGSYEDAIVRGESWLWHGVLTPMLNTGLLTPIQVLDAALSTADKKAIPLNSLEGFVRQLIGWREFMRA
ncbi:MAG: cryptochrome/photolyase family protein, partial [Pseudomonadota bacterium]